MGVEVDEAGQEDGVWKVELAVGCVGRRRAGVAMNLRGEDSVTGDGNCPGAVESGGLAQDAAGAKNKRRVRSVHADLPGGGAAERVGFEPT